MVLDVRTGLVAAPSAWRLAPFVLILLAALWPVRAAAQFDGPRSYWKAPVNTHAFGLWYMRISGNASFTSLQFDRDLSTVANVAVPTYNGYFGLFGRSAIVFAGLPAGELDVRLEGGPPHIDQTSGGLADGMAILDVNLIGAPAMNVREFAEWRNRTVIDVNFAFKPPMGDYDPHRLLNLGSNRWSFRLGFPLTQGIGAWEVGTRTTFELYPYLWLFTDNEDFLDGRTQTQDPMVQIETHLTRDLTTWLWASAGYLYLGGGDTDVEGHTSSGSLDGHYAGGTLAAQFTNGFELIAIYGGTFDSGGVDYTYLRLQLQYSFNPNIPK